METIKELEKILKENRNTYYKRHISYKDLWKTELQILKEVKKLIDELMEKYGEVAYLQELKQKINGN